MFDFLGSFKIAHVLQAVYMKMRGFSSPLVVLDTFNTLCVGYSNIWQ